ncbi:MAG: hypothetical protein RIQ41_252 [Candidatus Parcubacteria bacterium]|jgi:hypothetical protein
MNESTPENSKPVERFEEILTPKLVSESLRNNPEDLSLFTAWMDVRQRQIQASYISREDTETRTMEFTIELAGIYRDAGLYEAAADAYNDAADMAQANGIDRAYEACLAELAKI